MTAPQVLLEKICRFLGLALHPDMLDPYGDKSGRMADGLGSASQLSGDLKFYLHGRIDPDAAYRWKRFVAEDFLSDITWTFAETLGYKKGK